MKHISHRIFTEEFKREAIKLVRTLHGVRCTHKKKFRVTTESKHNLPVAPDLLDRQFVRCAPN